MNSLKIQRANLDGSNIEDLVTAAQGLVIPYGIALEVAGAPVPEPATLLLLSSGLFSLLLPRFRKK